MSHDGADIDITGTDRRDLLATVRPPEVAEVIDLVSKSGEVDAVVVASVGVRAHEDTNLDNALNGPGSKRSSQADLRAVPVAISIAGIPARLSKRAVFRYSESAVRAVSRAYQWSQWRQCHSGELSAKDSDSGDIDWLAVRRLVRAEAAKNQSADQWLAPEACERILRVAGVRVARSAIATTAEQAAELAPGLVGETGYLVLKAVVPGLLHKTDAGAVLQPQRLSPQEPGASNTHRQPAR